MGQTHPDEEGAITSDCAPVNFDCPQKQALRYKHEQIASKEQGNLLIMEAPKHSKSAEKNEDLDFNLNSKDYKDTQQVLKTNSTLLEGLGTTPGHKPTGVTRTA